MIDIPEAASPLSRDGDEVFAKAVPDVFLGPAHLDAARRVLAEVSGGEQIKLAFVSGSLVAGLGHRLSDVDLYVALQQEGGLESCGYRSGGFTVQVNPLTQEDVDLIASTCSGHPDRAEHRPQTTLAEADLRRCVRYAIWHDPGRGRLAALGRGQRPDGPAHPDEQEIVPGQRLGRGLAWRDPHRGPADRAASVANGCGKRAGVRARRLR